MKFNCAKVVWISWDVPGTVYANFSDRQKGSNNFLLYPSAKIILMYGASSKSKDLIGLTFSEKALSKVFVSIQCRLSMSSMSWWYWSWRCWGYMFYLYILSLFYFWLQIGRRANHKLDGALTHQWRDNADVDNADNENRSIFTSLLYISSYPAQYFLSIWRNMTAGWWADVSLALVAKIRLVKM